MLWVQSAGREKAYERLQKKLDMPNTASAKKRLRQNVVRRARNRSIKTAVRTQVGLVEKAVKSENADTAEQAFRLAAKGLDRAAARGIIHANAASRKKSRLQSMIRKLKTAATS